MSIEVRPEATPLEPARDRLWDADASVAHLSGIQTLIRCLADVLREDRAQGLDTAAFVSGYQGSPLGGFDLELQRAMKVLDVAIIHQPAVNEELAATAVMGSQLASVQPHPTRDGVLGVWYAKAPGLDRSVDALRHGSFAGASRRGGALVVVGDDPAAKSSTLPSASEAVLADLGMPVLAPRSLQQLLELGQHAVALSRYAGAWVGIKLVSSVADAEGSVSLVSAPDFVFPEGFSPLPPTGDLLTPSTLDREHEVLGRRLEAAARYGDANGLNRLIVAPPDPKLALVAAGTVFSEVREAMRLLGLDDAALLRSGVALCEVTMPFPLGPGIADQLSKSPRVVVIEERRELVESQLLSLLGRGGGPKIWGRLDPDGHAFIPKAGSLDAPRLARLLHPLLSEQLGSVVSAPPRERTTLTLSAGSVRMPWYCPGCPHSVSTVVPDGLPVGLGIGCHSLVSYMPEERVGRIVGLTQMGGEGAQWIGMAPFVEDKHLFQNMGDGTFFHSGHLALRAAIDAEVTMTFKLLWNGVSAMTGGQRVAGQTSLEELVTILMLEGVTELVVTTDDPKRHRGVSWPKHVAVRDRSEVLAVQRELAAQEGVTVMIHDQACTNELRRARKAGRAPTPQFRVVINERVCEGCGDCQTKSNCLSLQTVKTRYGPKTKIDEGSCNVDLSCLEGDCPAFMLVDRAEAPPASPVAPSSSRHDPADEEPTTRRSGPVAIRIAGIGGTGVVTIAHLLARAALIDGLDSWGLDQTGISQKAGSVISDLWIGPGARERSNVFGDGDVDLLVACDLMAASHPHALEAASATTTVVVASSAETMSGPMVVGTVEREVPVDELLDRLKGATRWSEASLVDAPELVVRAGLPGATANVALLGVALERGLLPVSAAALSEAIIENAVSVEQNLAALEVGRAWVLSGERCAHEPTDPTARSLEGLAGLASRHVAAIEPLADELVAYHSARLRADYLGFLAQVWEAEQAVGGDGALTVAAGEGAFKLLAYKDEYEVARLLLDDPLASRGTTFLLSPPIFRRFGLRGKVRFTRWTRPSLHVLRRARRLRGSPFDPFGRTEVRKAERALIDEYRAAIRERCRHLSGSNLDAAIALARLPQMIRGYEGVKLESIARYREQLEAHLGT